MHFKRVALLSAITMTVSGLLSPTLVSATPLFISDNVKDVASDSGDLVDKILVKYKDVRVQNEPGSSLALGSSEASVPLKNLGQVSLGYTLVQLPFPMSRSEANNVSKNISKNPGVKSADVEDSISISEIPNDPYLAGYLEGTPFNGQYMADSGEMLNKKAYPAFKGSIGNNTSATWNNYVQGQAPIIAVLDTGIAYHPDVPTLPGYDMISSTKLARDGDQRDSNPADEGDWQESGLCSNHKIPGSSWHGTNTAGIIGATVNNGIGTTGMVKNARIVPVRVAGACGRGGTWDVADGITWAAGGQVTNIVDGYKFVPAPLNPNPAKVISMSISGAACDPRMQSAIDYATSRGAVVVVAAGNEGEVAAPWSMSGCNNVIAVAALTEEGTRTGYSNWGDTIDVGAPVYGMLSPSNSGFRTPEKPNYGFFNGTSAATPEVSAAVALYLAKNPQATFSQVENAIKTSATPYNKNAANKSNCISGGMFDAIYFATGQSGEMHPEWYKSCGAGILNVGKLLGLPSRLGQIRDASVVIEGDSSDVYGCHNFKVTIKEPPAGTVLGYKIDLKETGGVFKTIDVPATGPKTVSFCVKETEISAVNGIEGVSVRIRAYNSVGQGADVNFRDQYMYPITLKDPTEHRIVGLKYIKTAPAFNISAYTDTTSALVAWNPSPWPLDNPGLTEAPRSITYTAYATPGGNSCNVNSPPRTMAAIKDARAMSCTIVGLSPNTRYTFNVVANHLGSLSEPSQTSNAIYTKSLPPPPVVTSLVSIAGEGSADLSWKTPATTATINSYAIDVRTATTTWQRIVSNLPPSASKVHLTGLKNSTTYYARVLSIGVGGTTSSSVESAPFTPHIMPPLPVTDVETNPKNASLVLSWNVPSSSNVFYRAVDVLPSNSNVWQRKISNLTPSQTSTTIYGLTNGVHYNVRILSVGPGGTSISYPSFGSSTPFTTAQPPTLSTIKPDRIKRSALIVWVPPKNNGGSPVTRYLIRITKPGTANVFTSWVYVTKNSYNFINLKANNRYTIEVRTENAAGISAPMIIRYLQP